MIPELNYGFLSNQKGLSVILDKTVINRTKNLKI